MHHKPCFFIPLLLITWVLVSVCTSASAGVIKIQTQTTVETSKDRIGITVRLGNEGTASAHNLQAHLKLLGKTLDSRILTALAPGKTASLEFEKGLQGVKPGRYPLTVFVDFHDANQYPFSAISGMTFSVGPDINPDLAVLSKNITMDENGTLSLNIKNLGTDKKRITATLVLPKELSTATPRMHVEVDPRSQKSLDFHIRNFSALPGAGYPVFCYLEYDMDDIHHTSVNETVIKIAAKENFFRRYRWGWIALAGLLIAVFGVLVFRSRGKRSG